MKRRLPRLPQGSIAWLLAHELTLLLRSRSRGGTIGTVIAIGSITLLMFLAGVPVALTLRHIRIVPTPVLVLVLDLVSAVLFTLLLSQTLAQATLTLYERGDLELLLSSPLPPWRVLTVRFLGIATMPFLIFASLVTPFIVPMAFLGHAAWLGAYGVLGSLALAATAVGLVIAMGLFSAIGPRRTKTVGQLLAAFVGAAFFLGAQTRNLFPQQSPQLFRHMQAVAHSEFARVDGIGSWPARAVMGDPVPLAAVMVSALVLFFGISAALGARFAEDASIAVGMAERVRTARRGTSALCFRAGAFPALIRKEIKLIVRDPGLLSQVLLRVLYLVPLLVVLLRNAHAHLTSAVSTGTAALVFVASQIAASLAWITISAEDSPELLASAPVTRPFVRRAKIAAALLPIAIALVAPLAALGWFSPWAALVALVLVACAAASTALINLWYEKPAQRKDFRRRSTGGLLATLAEFVVGLAWSGTAAGAVAGTPWAALGAAVALLLMFGLYLGRSTG